jgi:hypothetical protein
VTPNDFKLIRLSNDGPRPRQGTYLFMYFFILPGEIFVNVTHSVQAFPAVALNSNFNSRHLILMAVVHKFAPVKAGRYGASYVIYVP